jgi:hypothetical protein
MELVGKQVQWVVGIVDERLNYPDFYGPFKDVDAADEFVRENYPHLLTTYILGRFKGVDDKR